MDNEADADAEAPPTRKSLIMPSLPKSLTLEEKKYLLAIERGDMPNVRRMLQKAHKKKTFDINCVDSLGRGALTIAIDQENLEMVELLIIMSVDTKDALLHAINVEFVEAVELLLEHEEIIHQEGENYSWQKMDINTASFTKDITPLILAAHRNNYEILKILLDRGATVPMPHDVKCGCDECIKQSEQDSLRHSLSRLNEYKALASPSLIALSSSDPILTAFQLSWELRNLAFAEPECKSEYMELRRQCQQFAVDLLHQSRSSQELAIILNHDPENPPYEEGEHMKLARLELAIQYKQKKFVAHPNIQQLLAAIWYEGVPGFRRKSASQKVAIILKVAVLFPFYCMLYMIAPETKTGKLMRKPFMKFLVHASSYLFFLMLLILVSQRAEDQLFEYFGTENMKIYIKGKYEKQRGNPPMILEYVVLIYVLGFIYEETHEIYVEGLKSYLKNLWNFIDFTRNFLYICVFVLRLAAYIQQTSEINKDPTTAFLKREEWQAFDPQLIAEGLFAGANIFSALKLVHLFSINPHLGPLQISLGRMVIDIVKFFFIYTLVLFAFACGLNQLLWYFSDLEKRKCYHLSDEEPDFDGAGDSCMKWRRFANVFESSQSLFWASFGMVDLDSFELTGIKTYTRFWGLLMFGSYSVINVIVLLNLLIAMMSNSYAMIDEHSDTEWKFARTKLWMSYFEESCTLPAPFNIFPQPKHLFKLLGIRKKDKLRRMSTKRRNREERERDYRHTAVMRSLVWRYVSGKHRRMEENAVTEDDINELKGDISSFRYELLEVLHKNGMDVSCVERKEKAILGKRMKVWERRLMKDFQVAPIATEEDEDLIFQPPPENEDSLARFRRIAKLAILNSSLNKWRQVVKGACIASQIGHCHSRDSFKKQQNLQKAMEEAKKLKTSSRDVSRCTTPIELPDTTGSGIIDRIKQFEVQEPTGELKRVTLSKSPNFLQYARKNPTISIKPPPMNEKARQSKMSSTAASKGEPSDLINLESQKSSPVFPKPLKLTKQSSLDELNKILDKPEMKSSDGNMSDGRVSPLFKRTTLTFSDDKTVETQRLNTSSSPDNSTPNIEVTMYEEPKNKEATDDLFLEDATLPNGSLKSTISKGEASGNVKESRFKTDAKTIDRGESFKTDNAEIDETDHSEDKLKEAANKELNDILERDLCSDKGQLDADEKKTTRMSSPIKTTTQKGKAPSPPSIAIKDIPPSPKSSSGKNKTSLSSIIDQDKPIPTSENLDSKTLQAPTNIGKEDKKVEIEKSPLTLRNIRRVEDKSKYRQPKTGWF